MFHNSRVPEDFAEIFLQNLPLIRAHRFCYKGHKIPATGMPQRHFNPKRVLSHVTYNLGNKFFLIPKYFFLDTRWPGLQ